MKKTMIALLAIAALFAGFASAEGRLSVVATNFPCFDFARQVAGECAEVSLLIQPGMEVHSYDPAPADILRIGGSDLFVYIGGESDAWAEGILSSFGGESPAVLRMMDAVTPLEEDEADHAGHDDGPEYDEHIWTSPVNAAAMTRALGEALAALDGENAETYRANAEAYAAQIEAIDAQIRAIAAASVRRELVFADRFPFLYFVREYGLDYMAAFPSCTADTEASPRTLAALIERVKEDDVPAVYTIEMSAQNVARTVSEETGAEILTLHSLQNVSLDEFNAGESYVSIMQKNVEALKRGLL